MSAPHTQLSNDALSMALRLIDRSLVPALMTRFGKETLSLLRDGAGPLPERLIEMVITAADGEPRQALASSLPEGMSRGPLFGDLEFRADAERGPTYRAAVLLRLAGLGDPRLGVALFGANGVRYGVPEDLRAAVLAGAAANSHDPGWRTSSGLVPELLASTDLFVLRHALRGPFPEVIQHIFTLMSDQAWRPRLDPVVLDACDAVLRFGGVMELAKLAGIPKLDPSVRQVVLDAAAAEDPGAVLSKAKTEQERLIPQLRRLDRMWPEYLDEPAAPLDAVTPGDWDALLTEHQREPFGPDAFTWLADNPGCPPELMSAAYRASPAICTSTPNRIPWEALASTDWKEQGAELAALLGRGVPEGWFPVDRVLAEIGPARSVLNALPHQSEAVRVALAGLATSLGGDFAAWRSLYSLLANFDGPCTKLIDAARDQAPRHQGKSWIRPRSADFPARRPRDTRGALLLLLAYAPARLQESLVPHLDEHAVQQFLVFHEPSVQLRAHIVTVHGPQTLLAMAAHSSLSQEKIDHLLRLNDPEVNAVLYRWAKLTTAQRREILAGRPYDSAHTGPVPISERMVEVMSEYADSSMNRRRLLPICESGHPKLVRLLLGAAKLHTMAAQLLTVVRLWERSGPQAVKGLLHSTNFPLNYDRPHPLPARTRKLVGNALGAPDGLAALRQRLEEESSPAGQVAFLRARGAASRDTAKVALLRVRDEIDEELPWEELLIAHAQRPLPDPLVAELASLAGCPQRLVDDSLPAQVRLMCEALVRDSADHRPSALELLRDYPVDPAFDRDDWWLYNALSWQLVTPVEVLRIARPAGYAITCLAEAQPGLGWDLAYREAKALVDRYLGSDVEAWAVALRLLPDFVGTIPELLETAAAIVH